MAAMKNHRELLAMTMTSETLASGLGCAGEHDRLLIAEPDAPGEETQSRSRLCVGRRRWTLIPLVLALAVVLASGSSQAVQHAHTKAVRNNIRGAQQKFIPLIVGAVWMGVEAVTVAAGGAAAAATATAASASAAATATA